MLNQDIVLELKNITKIYPGTVALQNVNIQVKKGEVHGIIGKNGAGKSTLVGIISGIIEPSAGEIYLNSKKLLHLSRIDAKKEKIAIVTQEPQVILDFTVAENLFLGDYPKKGPRVDWKEIYQRAEEIMAKTDLQINVRAKASDLSISEQQLLLVLKAFYVEEASIIILDEASASLSLHDEKVFFNIIKESKKKGNTVILISHRTDELLNVCDCVTVIRDGMTISTQPCSALNKERLSSLIVGKEFSAGNLRNSAMDNCGAERETVLRVRNLTKAGLFENITFELKKGEILGLAGLRGSGRTEILKGIVGIDGYDLGEIEVMGSKTKCASPEQALKQGLVYLPEDREKEGLISVLSVKHNLILNSLSKISRYSLVNKEKENILVEELIQKYGIITATSEQEVNQLSGGNKQKVVIGRISAFQPLVFLLDEPTRGIDISAKESILSTIRNNLSLKAGVVMTSPSLEDLIAVCDRILVLYKGRILGEYSSDSFNENELFLAMQGEIK